MPAEIRWSRQARDNLLSIYVYIGLRNAAAAERLFDRLERRVATLARVPRLGPTRPELGPSIRILVEAPYLILYEIEPDRDGAEVAYVDVIDVVDGRRDL